MKFEFIARNKDQTMVLSVELDYQPGKQSQRARRKAVGELLAQLEIEQATVDASGMERVVVTTDAGTWIIAEGGSAGYARGKL